MTIVTRFRDCSFEEATACATPGEDQIGREMWESKMRGQPLVLITPAVDANYFTCKGPFFRIKGNSAAAVCPHIAEIGD